MFLPASGVTFQGKAERGENWEEGGQCEGRIRPVRGAEAAADSATESNDISGSAEPNVGLLGSGPTV